eukprot:jgi/Ulvmu1/7247/UM035_0034.1
MKLLMHNFLACNIKGVKNGYPLEIEATKVEMRDADFDPDFIRKIMERVNYTVLRKAVSQMGLAVNLPEELDRSRLMDDEDEILHQLHHTLFEAHLEEGSLVCPETGRKFPISKGTVNMLLHADEV